jgi:hypothetical protein
MIVIPIVAITENQNIMLNYNPKTNPFSYRSYLNGADYTFDVTYPTQQYDDAEIYSEFLFVFRKATNGGIRLNASGYLSGSIGSRISAEDFARLNAFITSPVSAPEIAFLLRAGLAYDITIPYGPGLTPKVAAVKFFGKLEKRFPIPREEFDYYIDPTSAKGLIQGVIAETLYRLMLK